MRLTYEKALFMKTLKLKIKNNIDVLEWCKNYSWMFRKLYSNFELSQDKGFQKELRDKFNLDSWFFQSCLVDVKTKLEQNETQRKKKLNKIYELSKILESRNFEGKKGRRLKFKLTNSLNYLINNTNNEITFGGRALLQKISFLSNNKEANKEELIKLKKQFQENRILKICAIGEASQKGNRKFDFDFENKKLTFKPNRNTHIPIEFYCSKNEYKDLLKLQKKIGEQAITVSVNNDYVNITFDNQKLNDYEFNEYEYFKELKYISKENKLERKECYKKWIHEQESRQYKGKNINRFLGIDLNPEYIGFSILEKKADSFIVLHKECIDLTGLNTKLRLSSTDEKQVYQNNKRIHELYEAWSYIFKIACRYKAYNVVIEDLEFKQKGVNENSNEANRKTKNIWHREKTTSVIKKYCLELGMKLIGVNACYSSFIGNIKHKLFDPISASIEICRRGITKYLKGGFYPTLERSDFDTMYKFGLDVQNKTISTWVDAYKTFKTLGLRYRWENKNSLENNLLSHKSRMISYKFT